MTDDKLRERLLLAGVGLCSEDPAKYAARGLTVADAYEVVAELDRLEAENARNTAIVDQLAEAGQELLTWYGPFNPTTHPPEINGAWLRLDQALATYRENGNE